MATTIDITKLSQHIEEMDTNLIPTYYNNTDFYKRAVLIPGMKGYSKKLNAFKQTLEVRALSCGWNPAGSITWGQRDLSCVGYQVDAEYCVNDYEDVWLGMLLQAGKTQDEMPFMGVILEDQRVQIVDQMNDIFINSATGYTGSKEYLKLNDGLKAILRADKAAASDEPGKGQPIEIDITTGTPTKSEIVRKFIEAMPKELLKAKDFTINAPIAFVRDYIFEQYDNRKIPADMITYGGGFQTIVTEAPFVKVVSIDHLEDNEIFATMDSNLILTTDKPSEIANIDVDFEKKTNMVWTKTMFGFGGNVYNPSYVICSEEFLAPLV